MDRYGFVYKTTNLLNGKIYIGQKKYTKNNTLNPIPSYMGSGSIIKDEIKKFGKDNFKRDILCWCFNREEADALEKYFIKKYNTMNSNIGYNIVSGGQIHIPKELIGLYGEKNPNYGNRWTDEQKLKMSILAKSRNTYGENNPNYGNKWSKEQKHKMSIFKKLSKVSYMSNNPRAVKVKCIEDNKIYGCMKELALELGLKDSLVRRYINQNKQINGKTYIKIK